MIGSGEANRLSSSEPAKFSKSLIDPSDGSKPSFSASLDVGVVISSDWKHCIRHAFPR